MTLAARSLSHDPIALGIRGALVWCTRVLDPSLSSLFPLCWPLPPLSVPLLPLPPLLCSSCCPCSTQGFDGAARRQQRYGCTRGRASGQMFSFELESDRLRRSAVGRRSLQTSHCCYPGTSPTSTSKRWREGPELARVGWRGGDGWRRERPAWAVPCEGLLRNCGVDCCSRRCAWSA